MQWHRPERSVGAMLAIAYITLFLGSVLAGYVYHAGRPDGIILGYLLAFIVAVLAVPFFDLRRDPPE